MSITVLAATLRAGSLEGPLSILSRRSLASPQMAQAGDQIENTLTGERVVFLLTAADSDGELLEFDDFWTRPGHRAAAHVHPLMQESWEVIGGLAAFQIGETSRTAGPGDAVVAPAGVAHLAWNASESQTHVRVQMRPALRWEFFIERLFALSSDAHSNGQSSPSATLLGDLLREFPEEIALP